MSLESAVDAVLNSDYLRLALGAKLLRPLVSSPKSLHYIIEPKKCVGASTEYTAVVIAS